MGLKVKKRENGCAAVSDLCKKIFEESERGCIEA